MKNSKLSTAIKLILAAPIGATLVAMTPDASAQQAMQQPVMVPQQQPVTAPQQQPMMVYPQGMMQPQMMQPQMVQPQMIQQGQMVMQPQMVQPQMVMQPMPVQPQMMQQPQQMIMMYPQGAQQAPRPVMMMPVQPQMQAAPVQMQPQMMPQQMAYPQMPMQPMQMQPQMMPQQMVQPQMAQQAMPAPTMMMYQPVQTPQGIMMMPVQVIQAPMQQAAMGVAQAAPGLAAVTTSAGAVATATSSGVANAAFEAAAARAAGFTQLNADDRPTIQTGSVAQPSTYASAAPMATLTADDIEDTNTINVESLLNTMPQVVPGLDRSSNNPGDGTATVDLRGLGSENTLVLLNGKRFVPTGSGGSFDLNNIPTSMLETVDVVTGAQSATYGSGAVAGVVNFKLKDDFEGADFDVNYQTTANGDAAITSGSLTLGSNLARGKGNVAVNLTVTDRDEVLQGDREFSAFAQFDSVDSDGNPILIDGGSSGIPGTSIFAGSLGTFSPDSFGVTFDPDGEIRPFVTGSDNNDFYNYAPVNYLQVPQKRTQATFTGNYELDDAAEVYGLGLFTSTETASQLAPTPIFQSGTEVTLDGSPFLTANSQQVLSDAFGSGIDTDGDGIDDTGSFFVRRRLLEVGNRRDERTFDTRYFQGGVRGEIGDMLAYDVYASKGITRLSGEQLGNVNRDRFQQALLLDQSGTACQDPRANGATTSCAPLNIFGEGNISPEAADFIGVSVLYQSEHEQSVRGAQLSGKFDLITERPTMLTIGHESRSNSYEFVGSQDLEAGTIAGFNGNSGIAGSTSVSETFGELYFPLMANQPGAELIDLTLGYRQSEYDTFGGVNSYKATASWMPTNNIRVHTSLNRGHRAPNIGELFAAQSEGFPGATDPCSASGSAAFDSAVAARCIETGVPAGVVGSPAIDLPAGQVRAVGGGNPNLTEEMADSFSVGASVRLPLAEDAQLTLGGDYFLIDVEDQVARFGGGAANILNNCYDTNNPNYQAFCDVVTRRADGTIDFVSVAEQNVAQTSLRGVDFFADFDARVLGGNLAINYLGTVTDENSFALFPGADSIECAGNFGQLCGEPQAGYKHRMATNWSNDMLTASVVWRHIGEVNDDDEDTTYFAESIEARNYLDAQLSVDVGDRVGLAVGVSNLTDEQAPIIGDNQEQANTYAATYDPFGRSFFIRLSGSSSLSNR